MPTHGYLAAIFRSVPVAVGGEELHQLLTNPSFETGDTTGWTTSGTVTIKKGGRHGTNLSYVAEVVDDGTGAGIEQTVELDSALTEAGTCLFRCWAKFDPGNTGTLKITFLDAGDLELDTKTVTMHDAPTYPVGGWGLWSAKVTVPQDTKKIKFEAKTAAAQTWYIDDCALVLLAQILGATGELTSEITVDSQDATTFASAQASSGWRTFVPTLRRGEEIPVRTFWSTDDSYDIDPDTEVFVVLYHDTTSDLRDEFWGYVQGQVGRFPVDALVERDLRIIVNGEVGTTDTSAT